MRRKSNQAGTLRSAKAQAAKASAKKGSADSSARASRQGDDGKEASGRAARGASQSARRAAVAPASKPKGKRAVSGKSKADATPLQEAASEEPAPKSIAVPREEEEERPRKRGEVEAGIRLYMREIGKVPLLTPREEVELAERIRKGDKEAREQMIKANLRLVVKIAHDYEGLGLPLLDLISEGNIGLMKAVDRFDPNKGGKLSTYAAWWIKQSIKRALANQSKTIRLPVHLVDKISRMRRVEMALREALGRDPTEEEIAEEMDITPAKVNQLRTASMKPTPLDAPIDEDETNTYAERIKDEKAEDPAEQFVGRTDAALLSRLIKKLDPRERRILQSRFGLDGAEEKTLEELGKEMGVTRERIRQIQNHALTKLRRMIERVEKNKPIDES